MGDKVTRIWQLLPAGTLPPQLLVWVNSPTVTMSEMASDTRPVLVSITGCVEEALKKNPNVKLEKTVVVLDVASSGAVKSVALQPHRLELTDWGGCIRDKAKRIVFPSADGESQIEIPLLLGAQVN